MINTLSKQYVIGVEKYLVNFTTNFFSNDKFNQLVNKVKPNTYKTKDHPRLIIPFYDTTEKVIYLFKVVHLEMNNQNI